VYVYDVRRCVMCVCMWCVYVRDVCMYVMCVCVCVKTPIALCSDLQRPKVIGVYVCASYVYGRDMYVCVCHFICVYDKCVRG